MNLRNLSPSLSDYISDSTHVINSSFFKLDDRGNKWTRHKKSAEMVAKLYKDSKFEGYSTRVSNCSGTIKFIVGNDGLELSDTWFCRVRHCPVCQWRRSLKWKARAYKGLPSVKDRFKSHRWIFLTLTIKNCELKDLRSNLTNMHAAFKHCTRLKSWPAKGWIKSTEVTRGKDGLAHPHFHCLLMVERSYFSKGHYLSRVKWSETWQSALKCDYAPVVDISAIDMSENPEVLIPEILKYQTKPADLVGSRDWLIGLTEQLHGSRAIAIGGALQEYFAEIGREPACFADEAEEVEGGGVEVRFCWDPGERDYFLID